MPTQVATCQYCKRTVGLMNRSGPTPGSFHRGLRLAPHASVESAPSGHGRRPRCELGSGLPVDEADLWTVTDRPSRLRSVTARGGALTRPAS